MSKDRKTNSQCLGAWDPISISKMIALMVALGTMATSMLHMIQPWSVAFVPIFTLKPQPKLEFFDKKFDKI